MEHYYTENPKSRLVKYGFNAILRGKKLEFVTASSTFSPRRLDKATELLIEKCKLPKTGKVLDMGCGYGVMGIAVKKYNPKLNVVMVDINRRALEFAKKNAEINDVDVDIFWSDSFHEVWDTYDVILTNPPIAAGMKLCRKMIEEAFGHLARGGSLQLVANHNKGGSRLEKMMGEIFENVKTLVKKGGIRVYMSVRL